MSSPKKKKVVVKKKVKVEEKTSPKLKATKSKLGAKSIISKGNAADLPFKRNNFLFMGIGILFILLGMFAMSGGAMPDAETWDADRIYGFRRTVLAPLLILIGLGIQIYAIFKD
ncbi:MAG: DUF3098 domain-containing protein [Bacteroidota bacterium]